MAFVVAATWTVRAGEEQAVAAAAAKLAAASREEPGTVLYELHRDPEDPRTIFIYEQYADRAAFDAHLATEHFQEFALRQCVPRLEHRERAFYETWDAPA